MISLERRKSLTLFVISVVFATCLIIVLNFDLNVYSFELFVNWNNTTNKARLSRRNSQYGINVTQISIPLRKLEICRHPGNFSNNSVHSQVIFRIILYNFITIYNAFSMRFDIGAI